MSRPPLSRRDALAGLAVLASSAAAAGPSAATNAADLEGPAVRNTPNAEHDPRSTAEGQIKMTATLDESPAFWAYEGLIYAVIANERPRAILGVSGCQAQWARRQGDGSYRLSANLLTFFRDPDTGAYLDQFDNPYTRERNEVRPNIFGGGAYAIYPADGGAMRIGGQIAASQSAPQGFKPADASKPLGRVAWRLSADLVTLVNDQAFDVKVQPQLESQTRTAQRGAFFDRRVRRLPARFSATTITPWLAWMGMAAAEGHLVWHTAGEKLFDAKSLPDHYRQRAGSLLAQLATAPAVQE